MNDLSPDRQKLMRQLNNASRFTKRKRIARLARHPWRMLYPKLLEIGRRPKEIRSRTFWGGEMNVIYPETVSMNIWRYGYFEEAVCLYMLNHLKEGMTFIDIGAHFGFFTLLGSHLVGPKGRVLAFEPTPSTCRQLQKNIVNYSEHPNIQIFNCAAYNEEREIKFYDYGIQYSALNSGFGIRRKDAAAFAKNEIKVEARKLDNILKEGGIDHVDLIKIDAESSEIHVLKGMAETLNGSRPALILEVGDFEIEGVPRSKEIVAWLQGMGYSPYQVREGKMVPHEVMENYEYDNLLFLPNNRLSH
jgi:FkbM family methyltransferase